MRNMQNVWGTCFTLVALVACAGGHGLDADGNGGEAMPAGESSGAEDDSVAKERSEFSGYYMYVKDFGKDKGADEYTTVPLTVGEVEDMQRHELLDAQYRRFVKESSSDLTYADWLEREGLQDPIFAAIQAEQLSGDFGRVEEALSVATWNHICAYQRSQGKKTIEMWSNINYSGMYVCIFGDPGTGGYAALPSGFGEVDSLKIRGALTMHDSTYNSGFGSYSHLAQAISAGTAGVDSPTLSAAGIDWSNALHAHL